MIPVVLHGQTGSGKTRLLKELTSRGFPVIDLESLANHRGSAFGLVNIQGPQPSQKDFEKSIQVIIDQSSYSEFIFLEFESSNLGKLRIPDFISTLFQNGIKVLLQTGIHQRVEYILKEYLPADKSELLESLNRLKERIEYKSASIENGNFARLKLMLETEQYKEFCYQILAYYDNSKNYNQTFEYDLIIKDHGAAKNADALIIFIQTRFISTTQT